MALFALIVDGREIESWSGPFDDELERACQDEAARQGFGARLEKGFALIPNAEIVKMQD